jgi:hypothetical protein
MVTPKFTKSDKLVAKVFVNGWQLSFISFFSSGFPIDSTIGGVSSTTLPALPGAAGSPGATYFATSTVNGLGGFNAARVPFQPVGNLDVPPTFETNARISKAFSVTERLKFQLAFEAINVFNHLIVAGASPLNQQEYTLNKDASGQSYLAPFALYKQITATQASPDGTSARRAQASLRITF